MEQGRWRKALEPRAIQNVALEVGAYSRSLALPKVVADPQWVIDPASLDGFVLRWPRTTLPGAVGRNLLPLRRALGRHVRVELADIPQPVDSVIVLELQGHGRTHTLAIDTHDFPWLRDYEIVKRSLVYFKMQYRRGDYDFPNVVPGGYLTDKGTIYWYLAHLRQLRDRQNFTCDVYGRFGLRFNADLRRRAIGALSEQRRVTFKGGFTLVARANFLREVAQSRVCIDLPGQEDGLCWRFVSCLAIGACVVGPRPKNELNAPLIDGVHVAWTQDDQSDLVDLCEYYVKNEDAREQMAYEARRFFDRYLHAESLAAYYLHVCVSQLSDHEI